MRKLSALASLACLLPLLSVGPLSLASAEEPATDDTATTVEAPAPPNRYLARAQGDGMFMEYLGTAAPATDNLSASPWASFAAIDSQGTSRAFAGLPYFGAFLQTIGSTVNGLSGGATPPIPAFPGYVETKYPSTTEATEAQGPYSVTAASQEYASNAAVASGFTPAATDPRQQIYSTSDVVAKADGTVTSVATAGVEFLTMGPLKILRFGTKETITENGDAKPVMTTETELGTFEVAGVKVGVTQDGFQVDKATTPLPAADALKQINTVLAASGIELAYIPRTITKDPVTLATQVLSSALRMRMVQDAPVFGPTTVTYIFGRSTVASADVKDQSVGGGLPVDLPVVDVPAAPAAPDSGGSTGVDSGVVSTPVEPVLSAGDPIAPSVDTATGGAVDTPVAAAPVQAPTQVLGGVPSLRNLATESNSSSLLYLVLVLGGVGVMVGQQLFSRFGIQLMMRA